MTRDATDFANDLTVEVMDLFSVAVGVRRLLNDRTRTHSRPVLLAMLSIEGIAARLAYAVAHGMTKQETAQVTDELLALFARARMSDRLIEEWGRLYPSLYEMMRELSRDKVIGDFIAEPKGDA